MTALRERSGGRVAVELDGAPWRTLPADVVVRAGLLVGADLGRERARDVRRELRRAEALAVAARALRVRERTTAELEARLDGAGIGENERAEALGTLARAGLVDDERFARTRAEALARRGYGDAAIAWDLEQRGLAAGVAADAVAALEPEAARAAELVERRGAGRATAALLARRGFSAETVESTFGAGSDPR